MTSHRTDPRATAVIVDIADFGMAHPVCAGIRFAGRSTIQIGLLGWGQTSTQMPQPTHPLLTTGR
jgi:hypothetical protein